MSLAEGKEIEQFISLKLEKELKEENENWESLTEYEQEELNNKKCDNLSHLEDIMWDYENGCITSRREAFMAVDGFYEEVKKLMISGVIGEEAISQSEKLNEVSIALREATEAIKDLNALFEN